MKYTLTIIILTSLLIYCKQETNRLENQTAETISNSISAISVNTAEIFADSNFTFLSIDSLSEEMLFDKSEQGNVKFLGSRKSFKEKHCKFFKTGCTNSFWDDYTFLVSKQPLIGDILPVIVHDSKDFNYYHSELFTLNRDFEKIDSVLVSLVGYYREGETNYVTIEHIQSKFINNQIITTEFSTKSFDNDSTVTMDSTITYRKIERDGHITVVKKETVF